MNHVLVIGAGPAGLSAASELARGGARVTVIERHKRPGCKACGGGITRRAWELAGIDPSTTGSPARAFLHLGVRTPAGACRVGGREPLFAVVDRGEWIASLIDMARDEGCDVRLGQRVVGLERDVAVTDQGPVRFEHLVGADGARSRVRKWLGLPTGPTVRALQIVLPRADAASIGIDIDEPVVWFDPARFGSGYGWSFPARGEVRIGCGVLSSARAARRLKSSFAEWLESLGVDPKRGKMQAGTIGCGYLGHRFGRVALAGDAAGLASPVTGEGIAQALESGREVAREILEPGYRSSFVPELAARHRRTRDMLELPVVGAAFFRLAPWLLKVGVVREAALRRFV